MQIERSELFVIKRLFDNECFNKRLITIAVLHTKLALEYLNRNTSLEHKQSILKEIAELRAERDLLLFQLENTTERKLNLIESSTSN
jgi:hypothetical protein